MKRIFIFIISFLLIGCGVFTPSNTGSISIGVVWPKKFNIKVIPPSTNSLEITITGEGLTEPITKILSYPDNNLIIYLPIGKKYIKVNALDSYKSIVAYGTTEAIVEAYKKTKVELDLIEVVRNNNFDNKNNIEKDALIPDIKLDNINPDNINPDSIPKSDNIPNLDNYQDLLEQATSYYGGGSSGGGSYNSTPIISSIEINPPIIYNYGYPIELKCNAYDPEGDILDFEWSCDGNYGEFKNNYSNKVVWVSPPAGPTSFTIRVKVSDAYSSVTGTVTVNLAALGNYSVNLSGGIK